MASIFNFSPTSASEGQTVIINGIGFASSVAVRFGGTNAASFEVVSDYQIRAVVGGGTSGLVQVFSGEDAPTLAGFTFLAVRLPIITEFTPKSQVPGQKVTIIGTGFTGVDDNTTGSVKFGLIDAVFYRVLSDTVIEAWPDFGGTDLITVQNNAGSGQIPGFTLLQKQKRLIDLPLLGRSAQSGDLVYVWDSIRAILCQSDVSGLPAGSGSGSGSGGDTGNIYTALGSPFKVRLGDDQYEFNAATGDDAPGSVTITDVRLLGKVDYVVSATDVSGEFENERLTFDPDAGSVTISNYQLTEGRHITIYADGVLTTAFQTYLANQTSQQTKILKALAPFLPSPDSDGNMANPGGLVPWFRPAIEIPDGWAEWLPGRGMVLRGQDPGDSAYNATTNPDSANRANGLSGGSKTGATLTLANLPKIVLKLFSSSGSAGSSSSNNLANPGGETKKVAWSSLNLNGNNDYQMKISSDQSSEPSIGVTSSVGSDTPTAISDRLDPFRIVNFIYSTQTA